MNCDADELADAAIAAGYTRFSPNQADGIELYLLCELANNGGGGGTGGESGSGSPEGAVTAEPGTTYYDTVNSIFWVKGSGSGNTGWIQLIGG